MRTGGLKSRGTNLRMLSWPKAVWHFRIPSPESIASLVCQLVPAFSMVYFLPITHTCLISALWLPPVWRVLPIAAGPHSSLRVPSPSSCWWAGLIVVKHCCLTDSIWFFNWSFSCSSPERLTGWIAYFPGSHVYLPLDLTICCDLATQVNAFFFFFFFFPSYFFLSASCRNYHVLVLPLFRHQPLGSDNVYIEIDGCAWWFFFSFRAVYHFRQFRWSNLSTKACE